MSPLRTFLLLLACSAAPALAQVSVKDAWVRGVVPGQQATGAYMTLQADQPMTLVGAASPAAKVVELHAMAMERGVMKMRPLRRLPLPAGKAVELTPEGNHIMLTDLTGPLHDGQQVPITLTLEDASGHRSTTEVRATVRPLTARAPAHPMR